MKPWLFVGAKVVCVDARHTEHLSERGVYTVRSISPDARFVRLTEIALPGTEDGGGWYVHRFRPVSTIDTTKTVETMRNLMLDASVRGKVSA